jgi:hypothetical protein
VGEDGAVRPSPTWTRVLLAAAVLLQLVVLYSPRAPSTGGHWWVDKTVHVGIFAVVAWTGRLAGLRWRPLVLVLLAHAVVSEVVQATLLPRDGDWRDSLADAVGVAVGALLPVPSGPARRMMAPWQRTESTAGR